VTVRGSRSGLPGDAKRERYQNEKGFFPGELAIFLIDGGIRQQKKSKLAAASEQVVKRAASVRLPRGGGMKD